MGNNGQRYAQYGISKPLPYQDAERLKRATDAELRCTPRIAYDRMLPPGVYSLSISYLFFIIQNPFNQSTAVSEKISFSGSAKKRWQTDKLYCNFWSCVGLCELQLCLAVRAGS